LLSDAECARTLFSARGENLAGLFTVDLPPGVVTGQVFNIVVRRIATRRAEVTPPPPQIQLWMEAAIREPEKTMHSWRYVIGTFAVRIPVTTSYVMLPLEENTLAIMKWRLGQMSPTNRWYPVLVRYISYIAARIDGLGGNSISILPSPYEVPPSQIIHPEKRCEYTGKVMCVIYDRFGDFEGFVLLTEEGHEHSFRAHHEREIEELVRTAWIQRMVITVFVHHDAPHWPVSIILRRAPRRLLEH
jgi:hypothetical protein